MKSKWIYFLSNSITFQNHLQKKCRFIDTLFLSLLSIPLTLKATETTIWEGKEQKDKIWEWITAKEDEGCFCGVSDAKDGIQRHIEAVLYAIESYAQFTSKRQLEESRDESRHHKYVKEVREFFFSYEVVDILLEGSEEIVAIRIQDGTDCELKFCDTYSREGYNLTDNCIFELSSVDSLDSSVKKCMLKCIGMRQTHPR